MNSKWWRVGVPSALVALSLFAAATARAQEWPARPVKFILPYPAGGSTDTLLRMLSDKLSQRLGQPFIVESKPGGLTLIGTTEVVRAAPDGYTLLLNSDVIALVHLTAKTDFDVRRDLLPITMLRGGMIGAWVTASLPVNNLQELIAYAKANPGKLNYASTGIGSQQHVMFEVFKDRAGGGFDVVQVPYKGDTQTIQALITGEVQVLLSSFLQLAPQAKAGKVRLIGAGGTKRSPQFPDVPTYREQGVPTTHTYWSGFFAPVKMPMEIARKLQTELKAIYQLPDVYPVLTRNGEDLGGQTPEEFRKQIVDEAAAYENAVKRIGLKTQ